MNFEFYGDAGSTWGPDRITSKYVSVESNSKYKHVFISKKGVLVTKWMSSRAAVHRLAQTGDVLHCDSHNATNLPTYSKHPEAVQNKPEAVMFSAGAPAYQSCTYCGHWECEGCEGSEPDAVPVWAEKVSIEALGFGTTTVAAATSVAAAPGIQSPDGREPSALQARTARLPATGTIAAPLTSASDGAHTRSQERVKVPEVPKAAAIGTIAHHVEMSNLTGAELDYLSDLNRGFYVKSNRKTSQGIGSNKPNTSLSSAAGLAIKPIVPLVARATMPFPEHQAVPGLGLIQGEELSATGSCSAAAPQPRSAHVIGAQGLDEPLVRGSDMRHGNQLLVAPKPRVDDMFDLTPEELEMISSSSDPESASPQSSDPGVADELEECLDALSDIALRLGLTASTPASKVRSEPSRAAMNPSNSTAPLPSPLVRVNDASTSGAPPKAEPGPKPDAEGSIGTPGVNYSIIGGYAAGRDTRFSMASLYLDKRFAYYFTGENCVETYSFPNFLRHTALRRLPPLTRHPHAVADAHRRSARGYANYVASVFGYSVYRIGIDKSCDYVLPIDALGAPPLCAKPIPRNALFLIVDCEQHVDLDYFLQYKRPILSYVFNPAETYGENEEGTWCATEEGWTYNVRGGSIYHDRARRIDRDRYTTDSYLGTCIEFRVDEARVCDTHTIRSYTPTHLRVGLSEVTPIPWHNSSVRCSGKSAEVSTGLGAGFTIPTSMLLAAEQRLRTSKDPRVGDLEATMRQAITKGEPYSAAAHLWRLWGLKTNLSPGYTVAVSDMIIEATHRGKLNPHAPVSTGFVADRNESNDAAAVLLRTKEVQNTVVPDADRNGVLYSQLAEEFAKLVVPAGIRCSKWDVEQVRDAQQRKIQIERNKIASDDPIVPCKVDAFLKLEVYSEAKDPRNISAVCTSHNLQLSRFTYAFKEQVLKSTPWYDPGQSCDSVVRRVVNTIRSAPRTVLEVDFSRFDGTISAWLRLAIEVAIYRRAFPDYAEEVEKLIVSELYCKARTASGIKYNPEGSRLSGSPLTTDGNTLIAAFVDYCVQRLYYSSPEDAFKHLGRHYGDDGVVYGTVVDWETTAANLGLKLKAKVVSSRVTYLGRELPRPWESTVSFQVATRVWSRLGVHTNDADPRPLEALCMKLRGYLATDARTPVFGDYIRKFLELAGQPVEGPALTSYIVAQAGGAWPQDDVISLAEYADSAEMSPEALEVIWDKIRSARTLADLKDIWPNDTGATNGTINGYSHVAPIRVVPSGRDHQNNLVLNPKYAKKPRRSKATGSPAPEAPASGGQSPPPARA